MDTQLFRQVFNNRYLFRLIVSEVQKGGLEKDDKPFMYSAYLYNYRKRYVYLKHDEIKDIGRMLANNGLTGLLRYQLKRALQEQQEHIRKYGGDIAQPKRLTFKPNDLFYIQLFKLDDEQFQNSIIDYVGLDKIFSQDTSFPILVAVLPETHNIAKRYINYLSSLPPPPRSSRNTINTKCVHSIGPQEENLTDPKFSRFQSKISSIIRDAARFNHFDIIFGLLDRYIKYFRLDENMSHACLEYIVRGGGKPDLIDKWITDTNRPLSNFERVYMLKMTAHIGAIEAATYFLDKCPTTSLPQHYIDLFTATLIESMKSLQSDYQMYILDYIFKNHPSILPTITTIPGLFSHSNE
ncbi:hypothetical protein DFA_06550 [Cavenderia fasciculata]|uniref:Uncharacterized protein n=1 Tax=Cavenderia fasciculata TaxID=261658 RepID=F4PJB4_CACFS|nr:uncharacterized protein DFA_06550 [Cavenderia fasciculata]EGG24400.1 hypothetical protein DFA_06550 [Cavenderia fasciculata]|eukprot:XP_004362251.1 hypothetical protein DFA_06550 [Cavenderia fasciculata]